MPVSPSHYHSISEAHDGKMTSDGYYPLNTRDKIFAASKPIIYLIGSLLFLAGSVCFYPQYTTMADGKVGVFASWAFFFGCICFFVGANMDFIDFIRFNSGSVYRQIANAYNAMMYVMASAIFILGAVYFLPQGYVNNPYIGAWSFLLGSVQFCVASLADLYFICITHEDPRAQGFRLGNLKCWGTLVALGTFFGALMFVIGSYYYLPRFLFLEDVDEATAYATKSINLYTSGCVFFIINALAQIPDMLVELRKGRTVKEVSSKV